MFYNLKMKLVLLTSRVVSSSVKCILGATYNTWVSDGTVIYAKFLTVILSKLFIEYFGHTINSFWLKNNIVRRVVFLEVVSAENSNWWWNEYLAVIFSCKIKSILSSMNIDIIGKIWVFLSQGRENSSQVQDIVDFLFFNDFLI